VKKPASSYNEGCRLVGDVYYPDGPAGMRPGRAVLSWVETSSTGLLDPLMRDELLAPFSLSPSAASTLRPSSLGVSSDEAVSLRLLLGTGPRARSILEIGLRRDRASW